MRNDTVMASEVSRRLLELISQGGDKPIRFMEPMGGAALPMSADAIKINGDQIEIWPAD
ncbi:hypothetical protein [Chromobacterium vaccinii]|uniref:hypothetical protein n=1 Tax=Chromobacterium vaccinii TaxID=1108595 RepID=UPI00345A8CE4